MFTPPFCRVQLLKDDPRWVNFRPKIAKWLCLCENYPYRISFLVLVIMDRVQKALVNRLRKAHPLRNNAYRLVYYRKDEGSEGKNKAVPTDVDNADLEFPVDMPIVEAYFRHIEQYIYSHSRARKMLTLDGDPVRTPPPRKN